MIDLKELHLYQENHCIEAKRATGGLPKSIWETYSAFANSGGGIILLGVEEREDGSLSPLNLHHPEELIKELFRILNNPKRVSLNLLSDQHVKIEQIGTKRIIVITVPPASKQEKPVYIDNNPFSGTYCRIGESDYHCTKEEVERMLRNAARSE